MAREYHVTCGLSKKVLSLADDEDIVKAIERAFDVQDFILQKWDSQWEDWLDVTGGTDLPTRAKLKVELPSTSLNGAVGSIPQPALHSLTQPANTLDDSTDSRIIEKESNFLKYFTPSLLKSLRSGERLEKGQRSHILNILYDEMCKITLFPTKDDYRSMAVQFVQQFPSLETGIGFVDAVSLWRQALSEKFRGERKTYKRKGLDPIDEPARETDTEKQIENTWGIPISNFLPLPAEGETSSSLDAHVRWMKAECHKLRQDTAAIAQRMEITFPERRRLIVTEGVSVSQIKEIFPCLFEEDQFLEEFKRLVSTNIEEVFIENLKKYGKSIIKLTATSALGRQLTEALAAQSDTTAKENLAAKAVPILLTVLAKENSASILKNPKSTDPKTSSQKPSQKGVSTSTSTSTSTYPVITHAGTNIFDVGECEIFCGTEKICKCIDLPRAIILLLATHYVFGIVYCKEANTTLKLIQHLLCNIRDTAKKSKKFLRIVNAICTNV